MKKNNINIDREVEKTLTSVDRRQRLNGNPWLFTRIQQRISEKEQPRSGVPIFGGKLQPILLAGLLIVNVLTAFSVFNNTTTDESLYETLADEYSLNTDDLSDYTLEY